MERCPKAIVLSNGEPPSLPTGVHALNVFLDKPELIKSILQLHRYGHRNREKVQSKKHDLTPRELEVLILLVKGYINKEIADKLNIGLTTVISHRKNITEKLGIKSLSRLTIYAVMHGFVEADNI